MIRGRLTAARGSRISCVATTAAGRYELPLSLTVVEETTFDFRHLNRCNGCFVPRLVSVDKESFVPSLPRALSLPINSLCNSSHSRERQRRMPGTKLTIACYDDAELFDLGFSDIIAIDRITIITTLLCGVLEKVYRRKLTFFGLLLFQDMREKVWLEL